MIDKVIAGTNIAVPRKGLGCSQSAIAGKLNVSADFSCNSYCSPTPGQPSIGEKLLPTQAVIWYNTPVSTGRVVADEENIFPFVVLFPAVGFLDDSLRQPGGFSPQVRGRNRYRWPDCVGCGGGRGSASGNFRLISVPLRRSGQLSDYFSASERIQLQGCLAGQPGRGGGRIRLCRRSGGLSGSRRRPGPHCRQCGDSRRQSLCRSRGSKRGRHLICLPPDCR